MQATQMHEDVHGFSNDIQNISNTPTEPVHQMFQLDEFTPYLLKTMSVEHKYHTSFHSTPEHCFTAKIHKACNNRSLSDVSYCTSQYHIYPRFSLYPLECFVCL